MALFRQIRFTKVMRIESQEAALEKGTKHHSDEKDSINTDYY